MSVVATVSDVSRQGFEVCLRTFCFKEINMTRNGMRNGTDSAEICPTFFSDPAVGATFLQVVLCLKLNSLARFH